MSQIPMYAGEGRAITVRFARRSGFEVRLDVLKAVSEGNHRPTAIMYRSNTSWVILCDHLRGLELGGFLASSSSCSRTEFSITQKGVGILRSYERLRSLAGGAGPAGGTAEMMPWRAT